MLVYEVLWDTSILVLGLFEKAASVKSTKNISQNDREVESKFVLIPLQ